MNIEIKQIYKHFKGNYYYVLDIAKDSETGKDMVIYQALYMQDGKFKKYVRPLDMFMENVERENYSGPRFEHIDSDYTDTIKDIIFAYSDISLSEEYFINVIEACLNIVTAMGVNAFRKFVDIVYRDGEEKFRRKYL